MKNKPQTFSDLAADVLKRHGLNRQVGAAQTVTRIQHSINEKTAGSAWRIEAISLKEGVLKISVTSGSMKPIALQIAKRSIDDIGLSSAIGKIICVIDIPNKDKMV